MLKMCLTLTKLENLSSGALSINWPLMPLNHYLYTQTSVTVPFYVDSIDPCPFFLCLLLLELIYLLLPLQAGVMNFKKITFIIQLIVAFF